MPAETNIAFTLFIDQPLPLLYKKKHFYKNNILALYHGRKQQNEPATKRSNKTRIHGDRLT